MTVWRTHCCSPQHIICYGIKEVQSLLWSSYIAERCSRKKMNLTSIDPSGFSITAWGQAAFQGGRNVRSWAKSWAKCRSRAQIIWWPSLQKTAATTQEASNKLSEHYCSTSSSLSPPLLFFLYFPMYFWSIPTPSCYPIPNSFSRDCILNSATTMADPPPVLFLWIGKGVANSSLDIVFPAGKSCTTQDQRRLNMIP